MFGLPDSILKLLDDYCTTHPEITTVILFGSRAMGKESAGSDIDLAIVTKSTSDLSGKVQEDLNALPTPYLFDVVDYSRLTHPPLREHIDRVGKTLFQRGGEENENKSKPSASKR